MTWLDRPLYLVYAAGGALLFSGLFRPGRGAVRSCNACGKFWDKRTASFESSDFEGYIVLDTQMIVGGKHSRYRFTIDDYCFDRASVPSSGSDFNQSGLLLFYMGNHGNIRQPLQSIWTS